MVSPAKNVTYPQDRFGHCPDPLIFGSVKYWMRLFPADRPVQYRVPNEVSHTSEHICSAGFSPARSSHFFFSIPKFMEGIDARFYKPTTNTDAFKKRTPETMEKYWRIYFRSYFYNPDLVERINLWMRETTYKIVQGRYAKLGEFFNSYDIHDDLKTISCPTLILQGDHDPTPIEWVMPIHENIAGSQISIIRNAGHWLWVEAQDQIFPLIRSFLNAH